MKHSYMSELAKKKYEPLSEQEERKLLEIYHSPTSPPEMKKRAKDRLVEANLRFIAQQAARFVDASSEEWDELIAAGVIGLLKAIDKFKLEKNTRLLTFAGRYIHHEIYNEYQRQTLTLKLPYSLKRVAALLPKVQTELYRKLGREPTPEELVEAFAKRKIKVSVEDIRNLLHRKHLPLSVEEIQSFLREDAREDFWVRYTPRSPEGN